MICDCCGRELDPENYVLVECLETGEKAVFCFVCVEIIGQFDYEKEAPL